MALTKVTGQVINTSTDVTVGVLTVTNTLAVGGTVSIGGTLTYEDVTNIDSVGLITARNGIVVGSGITLSKDGDGFFTGVTTTGSLVSNGAISGTTGTFTGDVDIADKIIHTGDTNTAIRFPAADTITAETGGSERIRIDSDGRSLVGTTSNSNAVRAVFQGYTGGGDNLQARVQFQTNQATNLASNNHLANLLFTNASGSVGAQIDVKADAAWGTDDYPARIEFKTTADGASSPTERLRIDSSGRVLIGTTSTDTIGTIASNLIIGSTTNNDEVALTLNVMEGSNGRRVKFFLDDDDGVFGIDSTASSGVPPFVVRVATSEKLRITSGGNVNIGGQYTQTVHTLSANSSNGSCLIIGNTSGTSSGSHDAQIVASHGGDFDNLKLTGHAVKVFANVSGLGLSESWRFNSSGNLQCMISGKGIDFSATSDASGMTSELLDDYEEGTWSPVLQNSSGSTARATYQGAYYTKIGRMVHLYGRMDCNGMSTHIGATPVYVGGFPFSTGNQGNSTDSLVAVWGSSYNFWENGYPSMSLEDNQSRHGLFIHRTPGSTGQGIYAHPNASELGNGTIQLSFDMVIFVD